MCAETLKEFYSDQVNAYEKLRDLARKTFADAVSALSGAKTNYDTGVKTFAESQKEIKKIRQQLNAAPMPADIKMLAGDLRDALVESHGAWAACLAAKQEVALLEGDRDLAAERLKRAEKKLKEAEKELVAAEKRKKEHKSWNEITDSGTPDKLAHNAGELLKVFDKHDAEIDSSLDAEKQLVGDASYRIFGDPFEPLEPPLEANVYDDGDLPEILLNRARERGLLLKNYDEEAENLLEDLMGKVLDHQEATELGFVQLTKLWSAFHQAENTYKDFVLKTQSRYDQALSLLTSIKQSPNLTEAEGKWIWTDDNTLNSEREQAANLEEKCDAAWEAVNEKKIEQQLTIATSQDDSTVTGELSTLEQKLKSLQGDYAAAQENLDLWEAAIPDHVWLNLINYEQAKALLTKIAEKAPSPPNLPDGSTKADALKGTMEKAEAALVAKLEEQDNSTRKTDFLEDSIAILEKRIEYAQKNRREQLHSAVRGDANTFSGATLYDLELSESLIPYPPA
ncbi:MAG: hypothetical protein QTN59_04225 [Candidatus Electrothrix communis]|nr:MAG: hypothetical protein QTN59_04225 [Candidatus Electrothrix communis]